MISIVEHLDERQVLIQEGQNYFIVSESSEEAQKHYGLSEVLVFPAYPDGEIKEYCEVSGDRPAKIHEFLPKLIRHNKVEFF